MLDPSPDPDARASSCPGCGVSLRDPGNVAPPHEGTSAGCWALYGDILAREYGEWNYPSIHRLTVDTYAAQHPGERSLKSIQAQAVHLLALHLSLEREIPPKRVPSEIGRLVVDPSVFSWLEPPGPVGQRTVLDVAGARTLREHRSRVEWWARSVWEAWSDHHETIRGWAGH